MTKMEPIQRGIIRGLDGSCSREPTLEETEKWEMEQASSVALPWKDKENVLIKNEGLQASSDHFLQQ